MRGKKLLVLLMVTILAVGLCACGEQSSPAAQGDEAAVYENENIRLTELIAEAESEIEGDTEEREARIASDFGQVNEALTGIGEYQPDEKSPKANGLAQKCRYYQSCALEKAGDLCTDEKQSEYYENAVVLAGDLGSYKVSAAKSAQKVYKRCCEKLAALLEKNGSFDEAAAKYEAAGNTEKSQVCMYLSGLELYSEGQYEAAYGVFESIRSFRLDEAVIAGDAELSAALEQSLAGVDAGELDFTDVKALLAKDEHMLQAREEKYSEGGVIRFGKYDIDGNAANGAEEIEWYIIKREGNELLLLSVDTLDCKQYNKSLTNVVWDQSSIRLFLNSDFLNAFAAEEKNMMLSSMNNTEIGVSDKVFLLSKEETEKYCDSVLIRSRASESAGKAGVWTDAEGYCWWWVRDCAGDHAQLIRNNGTLDTASYYVNYGHAGFRPAIRITIAD